MSKMIRPPSLDFLFEPTLLQRQFTGRVLCLLIAAPLTLALFAPVVFQAAKMH